MISKSTKKQQHAKPAHTGPKDNCTPTMRFSRAELRERLAMTIDQIGFSPGVNKVMEEAAVFTVEDLVLQTSQTLRRWRGLGQARIREIENRIHSIGLTLGMHTEIETLRMTVDLLDIPGPVEFELIEARPDWFEPRPTHQTAKAG